MAGEADEASVQVGLEVTVGTVRQEHTADNCWT